MNLLTLLQLYGTYRKVSTSKGGEYHGPCPKCGGDDRFVAWPERNAFWCRQCSWHGDDIELLRIVENMSCKEAFAHVGRECDSADCPAAAKCKGTPTHRRNPHASASVPPPSRRPETVAQPADEPLEKWRDHAVKLVDGAHQELLTTPARLQYLAGRGLDFAAVKKYRLGCLPKDFYRDRAAWGLPAEIKDDGKPKKLWLPKGIVIPWWSNGLLHRVRIRRDEVTGNGPRYYWVPGSGNDIIVLSPGRRASIIIESDLDALLIDHLAGDIVTSISLGTCAARPKGAALRQLVYSSIILVALDYDDAGRGAMRWWRENYPATAERWPVPEGKDPGEAYQKGVDLRQWIIDGLPVSLQPSPAANDLPEL